MSSDDFDGTQDYNEGVAREYARGTCPHLHITIQGNDETGLRSLVCHDCGYRLTRRLTAEGYVYSLHPDYHETDPLDDGDRDPLDDGDRDGGALEDANDDAMDRWARHYDELDGAPENEDDR